MGFKDVINEVRNKDPEQLDEALRSKPKELKSIKGATPEVKKILKEGIDILNKAEEKLGNVYGKYNALRNITIIMESKGEFNVDTLKSFLDNLKESLDK